MNPYKRTYILIIVDTMDEAMKINKRVRRTSTEFRVEAYPVGFGFCGLRFHEIRPTMVIEKQTISDERTEHWRQECLLQVGGKDTLFI